MHLDQECQEMLNLLPKQESDAFVERILGPILTIQVFNPETYMFLHQNVTAVASDMLYTDTINYRENI